MTLVDISTVALDKPWLVIGPHEDVHLSDSCGLPVGLIRPGRGRIRLRPAMRGAGRRGGIDPTSSLSW
jgi:hypothetical protein